MKNFLKIILFSFFLCIPFVSMAAKGEDNRKEIENRQAEKQEIQEEKQNERQDIRLESFREKALAALDRRSKKLDAIAKRMMLRQRIRLEEKSQIQTEIETAKKNLEEEKQNISNATDIPKLKEALQNALANTRIYATIIPKIRAYALTSALYNAIDRLEKVMPRVESAINQAPEDQKNNTLALYNEANNNLKSARSLTETAFGEFVAMKPSQDVGSAKYHLETGKSQIKQARDLLKKSMDNLSQIRIIIGSAVDEQKDENQKSHTTDSNKDDKKNDKKNKK